MLRSLYSAVSGVKAHQTYLDVTGNNIVNVNTTGFKKDMTIFRDMIYQDVKSASGPDDSVPIGGVNPAQVGLGVSVGAIETIHTGGSLQTTGVSSHMAISGEGFFVVKNGNSTLYTRAGDFTLDANGNLTMSGNGYLVQGYSYKEQFDAVTGAMSRVKDTSLSTINITLGEKIPAKATTLAAFRCNLCSTATAEIPNLNNVPGGTQQVLRPHDYVAYGSPKEVTYISDGAPVGVGANGDTYYDTSDNTLYKMENNAWGPTGTGDLYTIYYGSHPDAPADDVFSPVYVTGNGAYDGVVGKKTMVDQSGTGDPTGTVNPVKAGATYLDTDTGTIYTANSKGDAWLTTTTAAADDTIYAVRTTNTLYKYDSNSTAGDEITALPANSIIMDTGNSNNLFTFADGIWTNLNLDPALGLRPVGEATSATGEVSTTTQATIEAFGESIMQNRDWEDKFNVYDSLGNPYTMIVCWRKVMDVPATMDPPTGAEAEWDWYAYYVDDDGVVQPQFGQGAGTMVFGDDGLLKRTYYYEPEPLTPDPNATATTAAQYNWTVKEKIFPGNEGYVSSIHDSIPTGKVVADFNVVGAEGAVHTTADGSAYYSNTIILDFAGDLYGKQIGVDKDLIDGVTQFSSDFTTKMYGQDGYAMGELKSYSIGQDGTIYGTYSNDMTLPIAQVALATFANPGGLSKVGDTCFAATINSGIANVGAPMTGSAGSIVGNTIEMSNVDLSEEFVNLIRAQRGFQASSRVVTTSDQVLEELINLKR